MTVQDWVLIATTLVAIATAVWTGIKTLADRRAGVRSTEHTERRDTVADRDALINQLQEERDAANAAAREERTGRIAAEKALGEERTYTQSLVDHIYRRREPPPPQRTPT